MATAIEEDVRSLLTSDREEKIERAYENAWKDWWGSENRPQLSRWPRTRANNFFEYLATRLLREFPEGSGARFQFKDETFFMVLDEILVIRFKKADKKGIGSNISTQAVLEFCDPQQGIPGMPGVQKVEIVYTLNVTETALSEIIVVARHGDDKMWSYGLNSSQGGAQVLPMPQPKTPLTPLEDLVKERKKPLKG
jgi:hypothetical protein